jgi:hypothetical protein
MSEKFSLDQLVGLVRAPDAAPPRVDPVDVHVRSDSTFLFRDPLSTGTKRDVQDSVRDAITKGWLLGVQTLEWGYDAKEGMAAKFHYWLRSNEQGIADAQPPGVGYRGTYKVFTTEKGSGQYRTLWTFDSAAAYQAFCEKLDDPNSPFARLVTDLLGYTDQRNGANRSERQGQPAQSAISLSAKGDG